MRIKDVLCRDDLNVRLCVNNRWMIWDFGEWVVYEQTNKQGRVKVICRSEREEIAIEALTKQ